MEPDYLLVTTPEAAVAHSTQLPQAPRAAKPLWQPPAGSVEITTTDTPRRVFLLPDGTKLHRMGRSKPAPRFPAGTMVWVESVCRWCDVLRYSPKGRHVWIRVISRYTGKHAPKAIWMRRDQFEREARAG